MKKTVLFLLVFLQCIFGLSLQTFAQEKAYSWYCPHAKEHAQPVTDSSLSFVEEMGGYYLDPKTRESGEKVIYLTFDAGYENGNVAKVLDVLREKEVKAAFFILGYLVVNNTELVKRMADEGHTVCNHTSRHKDMSKAGKGELTQQLKRLEEVYYEYTGGELSHYYRPPEGKFNAENLKEAMENGYKTVFWSFAYPDWSNQNQPSPERAKKIILDNAHPGEIMLLHPTSSTNAAILGEVIDALRADGYRFGTLDELGKP